MTKNGVVNRILNAGIFKNKIIAVIYLAVLPSVLIAINFPGLSKEAVGSGLVVLITLSMTALHYELKKRG